jgi:alkaline phosphatase
MVAIDEEEPVQAMPVQSSIQMNSTSSGFSSRNGMIAIDDEEPVQAMPAEIMQQQGQRSGFVRQ